MVGLVERSILAAELIFGIIILRAVLLKKLPKISFQIMWAIVALRLLLPFSLMFPKSWNIPNPFLEIVKYGNMGLENTGIHLSQSAEGKWQEDEKADGLPESKKADGLQGDEKESGPTGITTTSIVRYTPCAPPI